MDCRPPIRVLSTLGAFDVTVVLRVSRDLSDSAARLEEEVLGAVRLAGGNQADRAPARKVRTGPDSHRRKGRKTPCDLGGRVGKVFERSLQKVSSAQLCGRRRVVPWPIAGGR